MSGNGQITDKVLNDSSFCEELVKRPEETLKAHGVDPTPEIVAALKGLDAESLKRLVLAFGKQQAAF